MTKNLNTDIEKIRIEILKLKESLNYLHNKTNKLISFQDYKNEDITVIIGIRNRLDYRIKNALESIRNQDYNQNLIKIIIVDYCSEIKLFFDIKKLCEKYNTQLIRAYGISHWNRAHSLNIGIKKAKTKYILLSDTDIIFERNYLSEAIKELQNNPYQAIICEMLDSNEGDINEKTDVVREYYSIKKRCITRAEKTKIYNYAFGQSIILVPNYFLHEINGLDENYSVWGNEDEDLVERLKMIGLNLKKINDRTSHIHQWHPKFEGIKEKDKKMIAKNREYFNKSYTIKRNLFGWGEP